MVSVCDLNACSYAYGLNDEPGCRSAVTTLNWPLMSLLRKWAEPTIARICPVLGPIGRKSPLSAPTGPQFCWPTAPACAPAFCRLRSSVVVTEKPPFATAEGPYVASSC